jgi:hypothetical protein
VDSYQPIYDAVRSRISNCNPSEIIIEKVSNWDISWTLEIIKQEFVSAAQEVMRPSVIFKPKLYQDGDQWCFLFGESLADGVAGFGETPAHAAKEFDKNWLTLKTNAALVAQNAQSKYPEGDEDGSDN